MGSKFTLGDKCTVKSSKRIFAREYVEQGIPFWRSKDVIDKALGVFSNYDLYISEERFEEINSRFGSPRKGDLLMSSVGNRAGQPYVIEQEENFYFKDGNILWLSEFNDINPRFLAYWLKSEFGQNKLSSVMIGSAQKALTIDAIRNLDVNFPSEGYQDKAVNILLSFDSKISVNQQTNQTLEKMAQTLFKSWFVDFDPVFDNALAKADFNLEALPSAWPATLVQRATSRLQVLQDNPTLKAKLTQHNQVATESDIAPAQTSQAENTHQHFPSEFEPTDKPSIGINGWIPKGWKEGKLSSVVKFSTDRIDDTKLTLDNYISTDNMLPNKAGVIQASKLPSIKTTPAFDEGHILISNIRPYFKKIWFATSSGGRSNDVLGFIALDKQCSEYVLNLLFQDVFFDYMLATSKGSKMPRGDKTAIMDWNIVIPPNVIQKHYSNFVKDFYQANTIRTNETGVLSKLRDTLLPKLISGELEIPDVKKLR